MWKQQEEKIWHITHRGTIMQIMVTYHDNKSQKTMEWHLKVLKEKILVNQNPKAREIVLQN